MLKLWRWVCLLVLFSQSGLAFAQNLQSPAQLQEDLQFIKKAIATTHPDLGFSADLPQLNARFARIEQDIKQPMTRDQAWRSFSQLNPYFFDAHVTVTFPSVADEVAAHLQQGGAFFPFEVQVETDGSARIRSDLMGDKTWAGARILQINSVPMTQIVKDILAHASGDSAGLQANLVSKRFWFYYWKMFGPHSHFNLRIATEKAEQDLRIQAMAVEPASVKNNQDFKQQFQFEIVENHTALLTVNTFYSKEHKAYLAFMQDAFSKMREAGIKTLLIDIRQNTGGDDVMWKEGLLRYFAKQTYRNGSSYTKKVLAGRASGTEKVGDIVHGQVDTWMQPELDHPEHFNGKVYVLVGRLTYSSAVLFSNVVQDFGFAGLVGEAGYARTRQSGGTNLEHILPNSRLEITLPRFILDRPSGKRDPALIHPDIVLPDNPLDAREMIKLLMQKLSAEKN
ncbi:S41 family peptidase [Undibacterium sp.]|uniref:S41 family peptidase n=1 Tax=Undibacterium sp. TaxID=1914977 RepID=UPI0037522B53